MNLLICIFLVIFGASYAKHVKYTNVDYSGAIKNQNGAEYKFEYEVNDPHTGDKKSQYETRHGDHVKGAYSLHEPDGTIRIVEYTSDPHSGFNAVVKRLENAQHPQYQQKKY